MNESPPVLVGESVFWLGSGSGLPKRGKVKWLGKLAEMGPGWAVGVELEEELPYGGIDGNWGARKLFECKHKHGLIVPASSLVSERRYLHSVAEERQQSSKELQCWENKANSVCKKEDKKSASADLCRDNVLVQPGARLQRTNERQTGRSFEVSSRDYLTQPRSRSNIQVEQGVLYSWMVDQRRQNERVIFKKMDIRHREFNRSLDDGLAFDSPRNSFHSSKSAGSRNRSSGIFALFKWFKKEKSEDESDFDVSSGQASPILPRTTSITGSVDTLFSTATANSFAYVPPLQYRAFGLANPPDIRIAIGPETNTYKNRIRERERLRYLDKNISLREKYRLYASGTLPRSVDHIHELRDAQILDLRQTFDSTPGSKNSTLGRQKRKAPPPPVGNSSTSARNLPDEVFEPKLTERDEVKQHRRTLSEPVKYIKISHVKGKRKAPPPPGSSTDPDVISISTTNSNSSKRSRKKRRAPSPPLQKVEKSKESGIVNIIREATNGILDEGIGVARKEDLKEETASTASTVDIGSTDVVCTDTLKLEKGILKPNMEKPFTEPKICPSSPVSPRPWYKRTVNRDLSSVKEKDKKKERDRRKVEDWMLESGFPRRSNIVSNDNKYNFFTNSNKSEDKRKSQISILTNISELDREAAEIIKRGKEKEKTLIESHNAMYYNNNIENQLEETIENQIIPEVSESPRRNSAKELISLFNAITNVTKVTVNSSFFSKDVTQLFNKEKKDKSSESRYIKGEYEMPSSSQAVEIESFDEVIHRTPATEANNIIIEDDKPGSSSSRSSSNGKIARVTIEELDEYDAERNSKSQVLYEANKQSRHLSPPIPTITEVSEGSLKSSPTSTIASNTSDLPPDVSSGTQVVQVKPMNVWICPRCTLENLRWRITCEACEMWRPNPYELREKAIKESKSPVLFTEGTSKTNCNGTPSKTNNSLYPNLSPTRNEIDSVLKSTKLNISEKEPTKENVHIEKSQKSQLDCINRIEFSKPSENKTIRESDQEKRKKENIIDNKIENKCPENKKKDEAFAQTNIKNTTPDNSPTTENKWIKQNEIMSSQQNIKEATKNNPVKTDTSNLKNVNEIHETKESSEQSEITNEEVRRARIAFFEKTKVDEKNSQSNGKQDSTKFKFSSEENSKLNYSESKKTNESVIREVMTDLNQPKEYPQHSNQKSQSEVQPSTQKHQVITFSDSDEKRKLKEMLIEMKHSLPKRPKPVKNDISVKIDKQEDVDNKALPQTTFSNNDSQKAKNVFEPDRAKISPQRINANLFRASSEEKAEAYLIESETVVEEIKIKKPSEKVSSSVQTSGLVTQISPKVKPTTGKEIFIPIKVEEHFIKDGILYTSVSNDSKRIGKGTFELMRPRDFACIKNIKTDTTPGPLPLYANMVDDDSNESVKSEDSNSSAYIDKLSKQLIGPQGVENFRARFDLKNDKTMNTLAVNRLLKRLENAIAGGNHELAAALARELAQLKVNCSVVRQKQKPDSNSHEVLLEMYVEDKISHQGPFPLKVKPSATVKELKEIVERDYEIPIAVQRWILGKQLAGDDSGTLEILGVNADRTPVFLYLVAPDLNCIKTEDTIEVDVKAPLRVTPDKVLETPVVLREDSPVPGPSGIGLKNSGLNNPLENDKPNPKPTGTLVLGWKCEVCTLMNSPTRPGCIACSANRPDGYKVPEQYELSEAEIDRINKEKQNDQHSKQAEEEDKVKNYQKLVDLEKDDLIICTEEFECPICLAEYQPMEGIVLRECLHVFCRTCLAETIHFSDEAEVRCPFRDNNYTCDSILLEREIKALVTPQAYEEHLAKSIALAETKIGNTFHCKTPDCKGWCIYEDNVNIFKCPVCTHVNCLTCQAIHEGLNCKQYQEQLNNKSDMNIESKRTKEMLQEMVDRGEAMNCPTCQVVLMKKWGCDWLRCSMCKTEICWITRGPRWGPNGKGDTSGGCQCGVNGIKCHPKCTYCH